MVLLLDDWQKEYIEYKGDKILVAGRQTGKSEAQAYDCGQFAIDNPGTTTLIISKTERQAQELLIKVHAYLSELYPLRIGKGEFKPLKNELWVMHGKSRNRKFHSRVICKPVGLAAEGVRGLTIDKLAPDEAQLISDDVFDAVTPMLSTTGGSIGMTGTPQGKRGFFYKAFENRNKQWKVFYINSEEVAKNRPISDSWPVWRRDAYFSYLEKEKLRMSPKRYRQEYLAEFIEDLDQVFSEDSIKECCILPPPEVIKGKLYLGVDIGRTVDPTTFEVLQDCPDGIIRHVLDISRWDISIPAVVREIVRLDEIYNFRAIGIDGGGLGIGVVDLLMLNSKIRTKVHDLNNSRRVIEVGEKERKTTLLKESMYFTLQRLMLQKKILLLNTEDLKMSLSSCQMEYPEGTDDVRIWGNDTHRTEGLIRAAHLIVNRDLGVWAR